MTVSTELQLLLDVIDEGYEKKAWHGPNLRGSIRGLGAGQAAWRPGKGRHNIWEIVVHCAYWKYVVRRRILGEKRGSFPLQGNNWFARPGGKATDKAWREDVELLAAMHSLMRQAVADLGPGDLRKVPSGSKVENRAIISGIAMHDVYHAGQIQLLGKMLG